MATIDEILKDAEYPTWDRNEQYALTAMMSNYAKGESYTQDAFQTTRVTATFIKILDTHLPEKEE